MRLHTLTVAVCLLAGSGVASAQGGVRGGVLVGRSAATLAAKADDFTPPDFSSRAGFSAGVFLVSPVRHGVGFEPEALFTLRGGKASESGTEITFRLTYIDIPLLVRLQSARSGRASVHLVAGPVVGMRLGAKQKSGDVTEDVKDESRGAATSFAVGGGFDAGRLRLDARYTWGLSRLNTDTSGGLNVKSREFTVFWGVIF